MPSIDINTNFCTLDDASFASQTIVEQLQNIYNILDTGGVLADTFKVMVNEDDVSPDFLHSKIDQSGVTGYEGTLPVFSETISDTTERFIVDLRNVPNYTTIGEFDQFLSINAEGVLSWTAVGTSVDTNMVMVTSGDSTPSYLHDAFDLNATYVGSADLLVATETVGAGGTDQKERLFVDVSIIAGFDLTEFRLFSMESNISTLISADALGLKLTGSTTFIESIQTTAEKYRAIRGQAVGNVDFTSSTFSIDNVVLLDGSKDPRVSPGSTSETVTIHNIPRQGHLDNLEVYADYNAASSRWEARPAARATIKAKVTTAIPKATGPAIGSWGRTGIVRLQDQVTGAVGSTDVAVDNDNINSEWSANSQVTLDPNYYPLRVLGGSCSSVTGWLS